MILRAWAGFLIIWGAMYLVYEFSARLTPLQRLAYRKLFIRVGLTAIAVVVMLTLYIQLF